MRPVSFLIIVIGALVVYEAVKGKLSLPGVSASGGAPSVPNPSGPASATLQQITDAAKRAGFTGGALQTIVAIVYRESSGILSPCQTNQGHNGPLQFSVQLGQEYGLIAPNTGGDSRCDLNASMQAAYWYYQKNGNFAPWRAGPPETTGCDVTPIAGQLGTVVTAQCQPVALPPNFQQVVR